MKNAKGFAVMELIVVLVVVGIIAAGGYIWWQSTQVQSANDTIDQQSSSTPTPSIQASLPAGWTRQETNCGVSVPVPVKEDLGLSNWGPDAYWKYQVGSISENYGANSEMLTLLKDQSSVSYGIWTKATETGAAVVISCDDAGSMTLTEFVDKYKSVNMKLNDSLTFSQESTTVAGVSAVDLAITSHNSGEERTHHAYLLVVDDKRLAVSSLITTNEDVLGPMAQQIVDGISL